MFASAFVLAQDSFLLGVTARIQIACISTPIKVSRSSRAQRQNIFNIQYLIFKTRFLINFIGDRDFKCDQARITPTVTEF